MAKSTTSAQLEPQTGRRETAMEKTTRIVRKMIDDEAEQRQKRMARLRKSRLERDANTPSETPEPKAPKARRSRGSLKAS